MSEDHLIQLRVTDRRLSRQLVFLVIAACGCRNGPDLPECGDATLLTVGPLAASDFVSIVPLGNLNPSGHTFPTDHLYLYLPAPVPPSSAPAVVSLVSPGHVWITNVQTHSSPTPPAYQDWTVSLAPCKDIQFYFGHVSQLASSVAAQVGSVDSNCDEYDTGGRHFRNCGKNVNIELQAGEPLGQAGGHDGQYALDFGAQDDRGKLAYVDPSRLRSEQLHVICPPDMFAPAVHDDLVNRLGSYDGTHQRTVEPRCGAVMQDIAGTTQGVWYRQGAPSSPEDPHLALVHDNVDPTIPVFSVGTSIPTLSSGVYTFTVAASGTSNRDFGDVSATGIYCWDLRYFYSATGLGRLVASYNATSTLSVRFDAATACGPGPWTVGSEGTVFER